MRYTNKAARDCGNSHRAKVSCGDTHILAYDVLLGVAGAVVMVGIPLIMALLKNWGWW